MLYNPNWNREITLKNFAAWLTTKPPDEAYEWDYCTRCACGQWLTDIDRLRDVAWASWYCTDNPLGIANDIAGRGKPTFGALAKRVHKHLKRHGAKKHAFL